MLRRLAILTLLASPMAWAATLRLYLTDGDYQLVTEYKVLEDRVRFLSADRGEWEEIPLELVDLKKTETEANQKAQELAERIKIEEAEDAAIRADRKLAASIPQNPGVYYIDGDKLVPLEAAKVVVNESGTRKLLQVLAPAPIVPGKSTVEIEGKTAKFRLTNPSPEFFFRLAATERLAIVELEPKKDSRLVENVTIMPKESEIFEEPKIVPAFKKQLGADVYRIWPEQPLKPGEYAVIEYTEGAINVQAWDFGIDKPRQQ
jgi:hypothetical protein